MTPVRTVFLGSGGFGVETLRSLAAIPEAELVGVVTAPPRPAGRRGELRPTEVETAARASGLGPILAPARLRAPDSLGSVLELRPGLAVLADYGQIVPGPILELPHGALNLHPSLLPRHRGATPIQAAILAGDRRTGVTLFRMDEGLDTGPIVAQREVELSGRETGPELEARLATVAADLLEEAIGPWLRGELPAAAQPSEGVTMTRPLRREDGRLDPSEPAIALERRVRALQPWPGSSLETAAGRVTVWRASVGPGDGASIAAPGTIVADGRGLALVTADGLLRLDEVQPAGGRRMSGEEFRRGRGRDVEGSSAG